MKLPGHSMERSLLEDFCLPVEGNLSQMEVGGGPLLKPYQVLFRASQPTWSPPSPEVLRQRLGSSVSCRRNVDSISSKVLGNSTNISIRMFLLLLLVAFKLDVD